MDKKHIIKLSGREFVTYEGLLDAAHKQGLTNIETSLIQAPNASNDNTAICQAVVTLTDSETQSIRMFSGIGDASPRNVSRNVALHLIRMSETRAKARALRDAINVGMCSVEELESAELGPEEGAPRGKEERENYRETLQKPDEPASKKQIDAIGAQMKRVGWEPEKGRSWLQESFGKQSRLELTKAEASRMLDHLNGLPAIGEAPQMPREGAA